jgi:hypothetical protein
MATNSGLYDFTRAEDLSGVDEILQNDRARATLTPVTIPATVGIPVTYQTTKLGQNNIQSFGAPRTVSTSAAVAISAGDLLTGIITINAGAPLTATFDTAANMVAVINSISAGAVIGDQISCLLINSGGSTITLAVPASGAFDTNQASRSIVTNTSRYITVRFNNVTNGTESYTVYF